jgi:tetratricopeptide (TPR) repeat protein
LYKLGLSCFRAGQEDKAIDVLTLAIETQNEFAEAYYLRAAIFHALGRDAEAETDLLRTLTLRPEAGEARLALIELYMDMGKTTRALRVAREEIDRQPQAPSSYLLLAEVHRRRRRNDQAIEAVGLALEQDPNLPRAYLRLGQLWLEEGISRNDKVALEKAVAALESVSQLENENGPASLALGQAYLAIGDEDKAFDELQRAAEATPIEAEAHRELGDLYLGRENFAEAATAYHVYLKLGEQSPMVLERLGDAYIGMDSQSAAAETYLQLAAHSPNRIGPLVKAARAYLAAGEPRLAARVCEQGLATDAQNETLRDLLARASNAVPVVANP